VDVPVLAGVRALTRVELVEGLLSLLEVADSPNDRAAVVHEDTRVLQTEAAVRSRDDRHLPAQRVPVLAEGLHCDFLDRLPIVRNRFVRDLAEHGEELAD